VPESSAFEVEMFIEKLKKPKSPGIDQILAELIKVGGRTIRCEIHKLIISIWNKEELPEEWKEPIVVPTYRKGDKTDCSNYRGTSLLPTTYKIFIQHPAVKVNSICGGNYWGSSMWISTQQVNYYHIFCIHQILEKMGIQRANCKKAYDSVRREILL